MNDYYVYSLTVQRKRKPFYIGKGLGRRADVHFTPTHLAAKSHKSNIIKQAFSEGKEVIITYIKKGLSESQALRLERKLIKEYGRRIDGSGCLANQLDRGDAGAQGYQHTDEAKKKIAASGRGRTHSEATKAKIAEASRNQVRGPLSPESIERKRQAALGRKMGPMSEEQKEKLRQANLGKKHTEETKAKMSASRTGLTRSDAAKEAMRQAQRKAWDDPNRKPHPGHSKETRKRLSEAARNRKRNSV